MIRQTRQNVTYFPRLLALGERLLHCPQHLYVVHDRLLEPELLFLHLLRSDEGQLVGRVAHLCEGGHQRLRLVLAEQLVGWWTVGWWVAAGEW